ncbi:glycoside hydrolase superfamily [Tribonema minus]|uniref:Glycoside hydrolase superfamily n=1 Tax=Tribonema minus TaxID=303371 RepID=A0A835ZDK0_9STRA|nr:glycoside hydrolase superfamily [Tribonema minus]
MLDDGSLGMEPELPEVPDRGLPPLDKAVGPAPADEAASEEAAEAADADIDSADEDDAEDLELTSEERELRRKRRKRGGGKKKKRRARKGGKKRGKGRRKKGGGGKKRRNGGGKKKHAGKKGGKKGRRGGKGKGRGGGPKHKPNKGGGPKHKPNKGRKPRKDTKPHGGGGKKGPKEPVPPPPGSVKRNSRVGVLSGPRMSVQQREKAYKVRFDSELMYQSVTDLDWGKVKAVLDDKKGVDFVMEFGDEGSNLRSIAQGAYDHYLQTFGKAAKKDGRTINVRPLHEMNGEWYPWCVFTPGNSLSDFKNAFKRVVSVLKSTGGNFKFQLSYAAQNASGHKNPFMDFYPGDAYVDAVCVSAYNLCGATYDENKPLAESLLPWYAEMSRSVNKPFCIAEMSSTGFCNGKDQWIKDSWKTLTYQYTKFNNINWFFQNKVDLLGRDWDLNSRADVNAFVSGFRMFKSATGGRRLFADIEPAEGEEADFEVAEDALLALPAPATAAEEAQQHL